MRGCRFSFEFVYFTIKVVECSPVPASFFPYLSTALHWPRERGEGGSRAQSREYPPACEGRWGYVTSGAGPRAVGTERGRWSE